MKPTSGSSLDPTPAGFYSSTAAPTVHKISGRVICFNGSFPLEGVTVTEKISGNRTITGADGIWEMKVPTGKNLIEFDFAGYEVQRVTISRAIPFQVVLKREYNPLEGMIHSALSAHSINR